jgi:hypothetical protein
MMVNGSEFALYYQDKLQTTIIDRHSGTLMKKALRVNNLGVGFHRTNPPVKRLNAAKTVQDNTVRM